MRAVWSFWSAPYREHYHHTWPSEKAHLLAWILSVGEASKHYPATALYTDSAGKRLLVEGLGLRFGQVELALDGLDGSDTHWWVLGKLAAYAAQTAPFVHLDSDVFLWARLPPAMEAAGILAQNPEFFEFHDQSLYRLDAFLDGIGRDGGWIPEEWHWYARRRGNGAVCCGILGGSQTGFIRHYAQAAAAVIRHPRNQAAWPKLGVRDNILVEQYFLAACLEYHRQVAEAAHAGVAAAYLFESSRAAFDPANAARAGYTHLIGEAKRNPEIAARLERRVRADYPEHYARCLALLASGRDWGGWR
ncbi:MAG: hypothetical protein IT555_12260 [Acetobacteraceae bacterium]|nr:hypothetical protein [Acetobacteraceae bacterium]